jgi:hypothetical protein
VDRTGSRIFAVTRDVLLFVGGMVGIGYQTITGDVNYALLGVFTAMTGVPGLTNMISLVRGSATESPPSSSASPDSSGESRS